MEHHPQDPGAPVDDAAPDDHELVDEGEWDLGSGPEGSGAGDSDLDADGQGEVGDADLEPDQQESETGERDVEADEWGLESDQQQAEDSAWDLDPDPQESDPVELRTDVVGSEDAGPVPHPTPVFEPTGRPDIDSILDRLVDLDGAPTNNHADVYEDVHRRLHETLLAAGEGGDSSEGAS